MQICPYCGSRRYKTLTHGVPRCCLKTLKEEMDGSTDDEVLKRAKRLYPVSKIRGKWYRRDPIRTVFGAFCDLMAQPHQHGSDFRIEWAEQRVIMQVIVTLLDRCDWDTELAIEFMRVRFKRWWPTNKKRCQSFFQVVAASHFSTHLSEARRQIKERNKQASLQERSAASIERRSNVFAAVVDAM